MRLVKKAQGATEYIIVIAVVIIIALIVVGVLGGIPGIGKGATGKAVAAYWASADVAITDYAISASGDDTVIVKNNLRNPITLSVVSVNSVDLESSTTTIAPGGSTTYTTDFVNCTAAQSFSYAVSITYTDTKTSASYTFTGEGNKLEGTCAT